MLRSLKGLADFRVDASDGPVGRVHDFYFDDDRWAVRYLVVETGGFLLRDRVLVSPIAVTEIDATTDSITLRLDREQVAASPDVDHDKPVSRQHEIDYYNHFRWPYYWRGGGIWGVAPIPSQLISLPRPDTDPSASTGGQREADRGDPHLRSVREVRGYRLEARDGEVGHVEDFLIDETNWALRYLVVDTVNWWPSKSVLVSPHWASAISWSLRKVRVEIPEEELRTAPAYAGPARVDAEAEARIERHYGRAGHGPGRKGAAPASPAGLTRGGATPAEEGLEPRDRVTFALRRGRGGRERG